MEYIDSFQVDDKDLYKVNDLDYKGMNKKEL